jgi:guanylate kinase
MAAQDEFAYRVVNDDLERAAADLEGIVRTELGLSLDSAAE